jgi:hypothetical protein
MATATMKFNPSTALVTGKGTVDSETVAYYGNISFSAAADTYATGGLLPLAGFDLKSLGPYADRTPLIIDMFSQSGSGLQYQWNIGTGKLQIFGGGGSGTAAASEITNGTALNGVTPSVFTDVINFVAVFPRK